MGLSLAEGRELVEATLNQRICGSWGTGRAVSLRPAKSPDADKWQNIGSWYQVVSEIDYNDNARQIIHAWKHKKPLDKDVTMILSTAQIDVAIRAMKHDFSFDEIYTSERSPP